MGSEPRKPHQTCQICNIKPAVYCCPRCSIRTCSLSCCKKHKGNNNQNCNGKRDRTSFISLGKFSDSNLRSDFHFLEDVINLADRGKRLGREIGVNKHNQHPRKHMHIPDPKSGPPESDQENSMNAPRPLQPLLNLHINEAEDDETSITNGDDCIHDRKRRKGEIGSWVNQHSNNLKRLVNEAGNLNRNVTLLLMPPGMEKRKKNTTAYKAKTDTISWHVEWKFHHILRGNNMNSLKKKSVEESFSVYDRFSEKSILANELSKQLKKLEQNRQKYCHSHLEDFHLLIKRLPAASNSPKYLRLDKSQTLLDALSGTTVIEYPTIEIVPRKNIGSFPMLMEEI